MLTYPACERNKEPILGVLRTVLPATGHVLEIASGTGQHVVHFAAALPSLRWQPTDREVPHREAIAERLRQAGLPNVAAPLDLDVTREPWPVAAADAIVCINMVHISPWAATEALAAGAGQRLPRGGVLYLYGAYRRGGRHTSPSNEAFDASLRERDPSWGIRDLEALEATMAASGLRLDTVIEMPANNLSVILRRD